MLACVHADAEVDYEEAERRQYISQADPADKTTPIFR